MELHFLFEEDGNTNLNNVFYEIGARVADKVVDGVDVEVVDTTTDEVLDEVGDGVADKFVDGVDIEVADIFVDRFLDEDDESVAEMLAICDQPNTQKTCPPFLHF
ncbi:hypothetical protein V6N13_123981 [Hibiscus sabdariffa]|uniref:Uncharacterized protein n=2 Tax=Hibiscus sabdariffa TaxID=183260 RepID=A0ABR1ZC18_9ROSI